MSETEKKLIQLRDDPKYIRNICILAHVDHGKTTISDRLISSNGIISPKLAGKIRWMDDTPQEQEKGITMKSSSVSLLYSHNFKKQFYPRNKPEHDFLVNVIDSPGHIDFSGEVSTAVRLCDGAIVVVDVLEGVCIQTAAVLRQAWSEKVQPCLVLNKIDRLFYELHLSEHEVYLKLCEILEQVNVITGNLWQELMNEKQEKKEEALRQENSTDKELMEWNIEDEDDSQLYFAPERGNVVFASALDGWGFRIHQFADMHSARLHMNRRALQKFLWGEHYLNIKKKTVSTKNTGRSSPMFVKWILQNIWAVYHAASDKNQKTLGKIVKSLKLSVRPRELDIKKNKTESIVASIMSKWLPLSTAILGMVVEGIPNPVRSQTLRMPLLWDFSLSSDISVSTEERERFGSMVKDVMHCNHSEESDVVIFVSKVFAKDRISGPRVITGETQVSSSQKDLAIAEDAKQARIDEGEEQEETVDEKIVAESDPTSDKIFIGFSRIFSGVVRINQTVHVLGPRYDPSDPSKYRQEVILKELYMLMGKEMVPVDRVPAGNVFGIGGVDQIILKSATISTNPLCSTFANMTFGFAPIVQVAVEPSNPIEMPQLVKGLHLLNQADPCVEIMSRASGDYVIKASGELHLERCLRDLKEMFAMIEIEVSDPIVPFRETIISALSNEADSPLIQVYTSDKQCTIRMVAIPLPAEVTEFLQDMANSDMMRKVFQRDLVRNLMASNVSNELEEERIKELEAFQEFRDGLLKVIQDADDSSAAGAPCWEKEFREHLWGFGPDYIGSNVLLNHVPGFYDSDEWKSLGDKVFWFGEAEESSLRKLNRKKGDRFIGKKSKDDTDSDPFQDQDLVQRNSKLSFNLSGFTSGFQLATAAGPLMSEPMTGCAFVVVDVAFLGVEASPGTQIGGTLPGKITSAVKDGCRAAFTAHSVRIVEPMYLCDLQVTMSGLSNAHAVLGKRRAKIVEEYPKPATDYFCVQSHLPVAESFGFCTEIRKSTSGKADAQLAFSHWQMLDEDPFFVPTTAEEKEEFGETVETLPPPLSHRLITEVRKRKGLHVAEKKVDAEKNRNLSRKK